MNIQELYKPYNFSSAKCHVIKLDVPVKGIGNVEEKLPVHIARITGIYISSNISPLSPRSQGLIFLTLNEGILKSFQIPIFSTAKLNDCSIPLELNETVSTNAILYGYFILINPPTKGTITIYLHYEERK